jgi:hypothetical protein
LFHLLSPLSCKDFSPLAVLWWVFIDCVWNVMAHVQKPDFVFRRNGRVHLNRRGASVQSTAGSRGVRISGSSLRLKRDGTRAETIFRLSPKRTSPFKSAGSSVRLTAGSRGVRISISNAGYTTFRGTGYPLNSPVSPSLPLPCVTMCHKVSNTHYWQSICNAQSYHRSDFYFTCQLWQYYASENQVL